MEKRYAPDFVGKLFGVTKQTVIAWCESGVMPAVNVASPSAKRKRWRMSEEDIAVFQARRANKPAPESQKQSGRRLITRPTKDFFAGKGGKSR
jgi:hypothetical protein